MKNIDLYLKILLWKYQTEILESLKNITIKWFSLYLVQHMLHQINAPQFYTYLGLHVQC